ncbi:hypothetical protein EYF80_023776 [Liparis tanakae]|uniref:Uncharacterized protein n=1 Tax=Liparis tanakae TaxID=230148 RepID=A0A4Z2HK96_9TELE|nr:hypothetical protein EYF80_023776 [Liparis tanakae]
MVEQRPLLMKRIKSFQHQKQKEWRVEIQRTGCSCYTNTHLKAFDGGRLAGLSQSLVDPGHDQIVSCDFSVSEVFEKI